MKDAWTKTLLGEVVTLQRGFDLPEQQRSPGTVPIVSSSGITGYHSDYKVKSPGVVTGRYGTLGEVFYLEANFWPLNTTLWVKDFKGNNPEFISYLLKTLNLGHHNAAGAVPGLNRNALHLLPVTIPAPPIQKRIASILRVYDGLIENNTQRMKIVEEIVFLIYREWFVNFLFPGHEKSKMVQSSLGSIPTGWEVKNLDQIMNFQGGAQPPKSEWTSKIREGYVRMIQIRDYQSDSYICFVRDSKNLRKCTKDDIMIARYGASVARICEGLEGAYNVALVRVVPEKDEYREFLRAHLKSESFQRLLIGMSGRTAQAGFNKSILKSIQVAVPKNLALMSSFQNVCDPIRKLIQSLRDANRKLTQTRDLLLPKLVSGEVTIEDFRTETVNQVS